MSAPSIGLESMTKKELLEYADKLGIEGLNDRMLKADIIERIEEEL